MKTTSMNFLKTALIMAMLLIVTTLFPCVLLAQTSPQAWYDDNPSADTFYIGTAEELAYFTTLVSQSPGTVDFAGKIIFITEDIDLSMYMDNGGWNPIGFYSNTSNNRPFRGIFDGNGHVIRNLYINRASNSYQGLFGRIDSAVIKNLALEDVNISAASYIGAIAGSQVGMSVVENIYVTGRVSGTQYVGGISGYLNNDALIKNCYSYIIADSTSSVGGIAGYTYSGKIENCYTLGTITGGATGTGGISGLLSNNGTIINSASLIEQINATGNIGRISGTQGASAVLFNNFSWEYTSNSSGDFFTGVHDDKNGESKTAEEIFNPETWSAFSEEFWQITPGRPPILKVFLENENIKQIEEYPDYLLIPGEIKSESEWYYKNDGSGTYYISNAEELAYFSYVVRTQNDFLGKTIKLTADIDLAPELIESELQKYTMRIVVRDGSDLTTSTIPYDGNGWIPIGLYNWSYFRGTFDGDGHVIKNLYINRPEATTYNYQGLFSFPIGSLIKNLGVIDATVIGGISSNGILAGAAQNIENCFTTGSVSGGGGSVGGIAGRMNNALNSYSTANVVLQSGVYDSSFCDGAGGVYGCNGSAGIFSKLYATGAVTGRNGSGVGTLSNEPTTGVGRVALNDSVSNYRVGGNASANIIAENYAWDGMTANGVIITTGQRDNVHGADVTADEIYSGIVWDANHANYPTDIWIIEKGKLPILRVFEEKNDERGGVSVQPSAIPDYIMAEVTPEVPDPEKSVVVSGMNRGFQIGLADEFGAWIHEPVFPDSSEIEFIVGYEEGAFTLWLGIDGVYPAVTVANILADEMFNVGNYFYNVEIPEGVSNIRINFPADGTEYVPLTQAGNIALLKTDAEAWLSFEYYGIQYGDISVALDGSGIFPELGIEPPVTLVSATPSAYVTKLNGNKNDLTVTVTETYSDGSTEAFTKTFLINNNAAGTYDVGEYIVYVDTKGNTQIRECYIVN